MASLTIPKIQRGGFTQPESVLNVCFDDVSINVDEALQTVTGSCGGVAAKFPAFINGLRTVDLVAEGYIQLDADATHGFGQNSTITPGLKVQAFDWAFRRAWPLEDATGGTSDIASTEKEWNNGLSRISGSVRGIVTSAFGTDFDTQSVTMATDIDQFGTLTGTAAIANKALKAQFEKGGSVPYQFAFVYSGPVTYTGTTFAWLFPDESGSNNPADPIKGDFTLDTDSGADQSHSALVYDITIRASAQDGGKIPVTMRMRYDEAEPVA